MVTNYSLLDYVFQNRQYQYYGAGLLSTYDKFSEHQTVIVGNKKKKKPFVLKKEKIKKEDKDSSYFEHDQVC